MYVEVLIEQDRFSVAVKILNTPIERYSTMEDGYCKFIACVGNWQRCGLPVRIGVRGIGPVEHFVWRMGQAGIPVVVHHILDFKRKDRTTGKRGERKTGMDQGAES